jgi:hypothetical protein
MESHPVKLDVLLLSGSFPTHFIKGIYQEFDGDG